MNIDETAVCYFINSLQLEVYVSLITYTIQFDVYIGFLNALKLEFN